MPEVKPWFDHKEEKYTENLANVEEAVENYKTEIKTKGNYCFPNFLAKFMSKVSQRTQYEATLLSLTFILIGLIIMGIYLVFFIEIGIFMKVMFAINTIAGFIFLSSFLITSYQQYKNYLMVMGILNSEEK